MTLHKSAFKRAPAIYKAREKWTRNDNKHGENFWNCMSINGSSVFCQQLHAHIMSQHRECVQKVHFSLDEFLETQHKRFADHYPIKDTKSNYFNVVNNQSQRSSIGFARTVEQLCLCVRVYLTDWTLETEIKTRFVILNFPPCKITKWLNKCMSLIKSFVKLPFCLQKRDLPICMPMMTNIELPWDAVKFCICIYVSVVCVCAFFCYLKLI